MDGGVLATRPDRAERDAQRAALAAAEAHLQATVDGLDDEAAAEPSRLPGWSRAVLVTHVARNADSNARMIAAALRGEHRPQYPGGPDERRRGIEAGRGRSAAEVAADLRAAAAELAGVFDRVGPEQWDVVVPAGVGPRPVWDRLQGRWFEVEVHHVDLAAGYEVRDWPDEFVDLSLRRTVARLGDQAGRPVPGRWGLAAAGGPAWTVEVGDGGVTVTPGAHGPHEGADGTAAAPGAVLLAWLIGRAGRDAVDVRGDRAVADLPAWFPAP